MTKGLFEKMATKFRNAHPKSIKVSPPDREAAYDGYCVREGKFCFRLDSSRVNENFSISRFY